MTLPNQFYENTDVIALAKTLLGMTLITKIEGAVTGGIITETEAYNGISDKACHAFGGKRTPRTETMFQKGGIAYVYLCYGIHELFNVVVGDETDAKVVLIRAVYPCIGVGQILKRRKQTKMTSSICGGPGKMSQGLGIDRSFNGVSLASNRVWIEDRGIKVPNTEVETSTRIGVDYAGEDAQLPYRFVWTNPVKPL